MAPLEGRRALCCAVAMIFLFAGHSSFGQDTGSETSSLPANWQSLSTDEFVSQVRPLYQKKVLSADDRAQVQEHAVSLIKNVDFKQVSTADYPMLEGLQELSWKGLDSDIRAQIRKDMADRVEQWEDRPYDEIRGKVLMMVRAKNHLAAYSEARRWVSAGGTLERVQQSAQGQVDLTDPRAPLGIKVLYNGGEELYGTFSVKWEGRVVPTQTGNYTFSVSPSNINASYPQYVIKETMRVYVDGNLVVDATPESWSYASQPIQLTAEQPVPLVVELTLKSSIPRYPHGVLHALLFWEGPGVAKSIVPNDALLLPDADTHGLQATYVSPKKGQSKTITQVDKTIDFIWPYDGLVVGDSDVGDGGLAATISRYIWNNATDEATLNDLEAKGELHPLIQNPDGAASGSTTEQRESFLQFILDRPTLLDPVSPERFWLFFRTFHIGSTDTALDVFGTWAERHPLPVSSVPGSLPASYFRQGIRGACRDIAVCFFYETPAQAAVLQEQYLVQSDGSCCLPIAYTLAYGHQTTGKIADWISFLDSKLGDGSVTGDARVSWLMARAHAQEIRLSFQRPHVALKERILDSRTWVDEANQVAQSQDMKVFAGQELAARLAASGDFDAARAAVNAVTGVDSQDLVTQLDSVRQQIDRLETLAADDLVAQASQAREAHLKELRRRQELASQSGDDQSVARYEAMIQAFSNQ